MGQWIRDFWVQWVLLGVVAVIGTWVSYIRELDPILLGLIWFTLLIIITQIVTKWQEKKIIKRLNVQKERWGRLQEERMKLGESHRRCLEIPKLLSELNDIVNRIV